MVLLPSLLPLPLEHGGYAMEGANGFTELSCTGIPSLPGYAPCTPADQDWVELFISINIVVSVNRLPPGGGALTEKSSEKRRKSCVFDGEGAQAESAPGLESSYAKATEDESGGVKLACQP